MGLIDRLNDPSEPDSAIARAFALRNTSAPAEPDGIPSPESGMDLAASVPVDAGAAIRALLKELQVQHDFGITSPSHLFSLLHRHLAVERGALMVPAPEDEHLPIATTGLDRTSTLRLRFTNDEITEILEGPRVTIVSGSARELFASRLSLADYRHSPRLAFFPFYHLNRLLATLIIFGSPFLELEPTVLDVILGALSDSAGRMLFDGRHKPLGYRSRAVVLQPDQMATAIARLQRSRRDAGLQVVEVDLTSTVELILEVHPYLDRERLTSDMIDTVALLLSETHSIVRRGNGRILLIGLENPSVDGELLVHVLSTTIVHLFGAGSRHLLSYRELSIDEIVRET
jgi:hypothetical protein